MRRNIVEGEPGIFPDPIARLMRSVGRWVRRHTGKEGQPSEDEARPGPDRSGEPPDEAPPGPPAF